MEDGQEELAVVKESGRKSCSLQGSRETEECGGLNKKGPFRLMFECLIPRGGTIWEELGGVALLEDVCHLGEWL